MFGLEILDVAVGLVLTYLLISLILTSVQEGIEALLKTRAVDLERAIGEILQGDQTLVKEFYKHPLIHALYIGQPSPDPAARASGLTKKQLPSYIPRETFSAALLDLREAAQNPDLAKALKGLEGIVGDRPEQLRKELEGWYDAAMDRASGWFKRRTQGTLFWMGLAIAIFLNINSVTIARQLATDEQARVYADQLAAEITRSDTTPTVKTDAINLRMKELKNVGLPIGWDQPARDKIALTWPNLTPPWRDGRWGWDDLFPLVTLSLGYLTTAFALMLGAPFWFDVLNRIMVIRSTIKPTEKSPDEPSQEGGHKPPAPGPAPAKTPKPGKS